MSDILKAANGSGVTFSATSSRADSWMQANYVVNDSASVVFELPTDKDEALAFENAAKEAGFEISNL